MMYTTENSQTLKLAAALAFLALVIALSAPLASAQNAAGSIGQPNTVPWTLNVSGGPSQAPTAVPGNATGVNQSQGRVTEVEMPPV